MASAPTIAAARNGTIENAKIPSEASFRSLRGLYFVRPAWRAERSMATLIWWKPKRQADGKTPNNRSGAARTPCDSRGAHKPRRIPGGSVLEGSIRLPADPEDRRRAGRQHRPLRDPERRRVPFDARSCERAPLL